MTKAKKKGITVRQVVSRKKTAQASDVVSKKVKAPVKKAKKIVEEKKRKVVKRKKQVVVKANNADSPKMNLNTFDTDDLVENLMKNNEIHRRVEEQRRRLMWVGVAIVMFLIVAVWGYSLQKSFVNNELKEDGVVVFEEDNWGDIANDIADQLEEIKQGLDKLDDFKTDGETSVSTTTELVLPVVENVDEVDQLASDEKVIASTSEEVVE